jgi:hypothetical protein
MARTNAVCKNGLAALLRGKEDRRAGLDVQLYCKVETCGVCGPLKRARLVWHVLLTFAGKPIHAVMFDDSDEESWENFHKKYVTRHGANYHRIPSQDGKRIVLTDAEVGEVITAEDVEMIVYIQPHQKGRRWRSSKEWKLPQGSGQWERLGLTSSDKNRKAVYDQAGWQPRKAYWITWLPAVLNLTLPASNRDLEKVMDDLGMPTEVRRGENGWPLSAE